MQPVAIREIVAPLSVRCKLSTLVPYLRQLSAQRKEATQAFYPFIKIAS